MARSIATIYNEIINEKQQQTALGALLPAEEKFDSFLNDLTTNSRVALWRLWAYITAVAINVHEQLWDIFKIDLKKIIEGAIYGTPAWYEQQSLQFQLGDPLIIANNQVTYENPDPDKRIIKKVALIEPPKRVEGENDADESTRQDWMVILKVAKETNGALSPLETNELVAFKEYIRIIKPAGINLNVISLSADYLRIQCEIFYDPLREADEIKNSVKTAVENYLLRLDFNGVVFIQKITDAIQQVDGINNVSLLQCQARVGNEDRAFTAAGTYETAAGYIVLEDKAEHTFEDTITFTPGT